METYYSNVREDILALLPDDMFGRVLEIGGGDFDTLLSLSQKHKFETWGLDIRRSDAPLDHMVVGSVSDAGVTGQIPEGAFDLVIANDVIEHVADTDAFVHAVKWALKSGGLLALSVPNARQIRLVFHILLRGHFPREDAGLFDRTHLRWFTKKDVMSTFCKPEFSLLTSKSAGRMVPEIFENSVLGELLGLHNLFVFRKL